MKNIKRIIALLAVFAVFFTVAYAPSAAAETSATKPSKAYALEKLGILTEKEDAVYAQPITRGDFAYNLGKLLKQSGESTTVRYFSDVADYDYAEPYINALAEMKIISVDSERRFYPNNNITAQEAIKMVVSALGYTPLAEARGGYPYGYIQAAKDGDLLDGISVGSGDEITLGAAAELLFNTLIEPQYLPTSIKSGEDSSTAYKKSYDNIFLKELYGLDYVSGCLSGSNGVNIKFDVESDENSIVADGTKCRIDGETEDYTEFIGREVTVLYNEKTEYVFYIFESDSQSQKEMKIDIGDFSGYQNGNITYYSDKNTLKSVNVSNAVIIYNNAVPKNDITDLFLNLTCGYIRLISTTNGAYDAVMIYDCRPFVLKSADSTSEVLYSESDDTVIDLNKFDIVNIRDKAANKVELKDIAPKSVMNVYASQNGERIDVIVSDVSSEGIVTAINGGEGTIAIDSTVYDIEDKYKDRVLKPLTVGVTACVYSDIFGHIIHARVTDSDGMTLGYLIAAKTADDGFADTLKFKIFSANAEMITAESTDNIKIDGSSYRSAASAALAAIPGGGTQPQVIRYSVNTDGKINKIDTYNEGTENPNVTLNRVKDGQSYSIKYNFRIDSDLVLSSDTKFFCVPDDENVNSADESEFSVVKQGSFNSTVSFKFECYKAKGENEFADAVVYRVNPDDSENNDYLNSNMFVVGENLEAIDENGDEYRQINGMVRGRNSSIKVYDESLKKTNVSTKDICEGDLIRYRTAYNGRISAIEMLYDESENKRIGWANDNETYSLFASSYGSNFQLSYGYVSEKGDSVIGWGYKTGQKTDERINAAQTTFMFYDKDSKTDKVYKGNYRDIKDYKTTPNSEDIIIVQMNQGTIQAAVVYKK